MFGAIAVIYLCFPTRNYFFDGIDFAQTIEDLPAFHPSLLHPNHLVYNLVGSIFYRLILGLGINIRAVAALQILNSLLSVLSAYVLFVILKSMLKSRYFCYALTLLFAFSATWWKFSTDADAYIPSVLFLLLSFYLALPNRKPKPLLVALTYSISLCFHQIAVVSFPVFVVALFFQDASVARQRRMINALVFGGTAGLITLSAYAYSFYRLTQTFNLTNFVRWMVSYAPDESFGFHAWNNLGFTLRGHSRLFFGGRLNASKGLVDPFMIGLFIVLAALFLIFAVQVIRHFKKPDLQWLRALRQDPVRRTLAMLCLLWISLYLIFLFFLLAHHTFYRLFYLPALIILLGLCRDSIKPVLRSYRLALFVAILFITNFVTLIFPYSHVQKYPPLVLALEMNQVWPPGTVIYYGRPNSDASLVRYFNPGMIWTELDAKSPEVIEREVGEASARGASVWFETTAIDQLSATPEGAAWLERHKKQESLRALTSKAHNIRFVQVVPAK
ncbi:MAG: hypothetical protein AABN95_22200 [Acidobacteriota bacterium]